MSESNIQPAKYDENSFKERDAINLVERWVLKTRRAMPFLVSNDRTPNHDGSIELLNEDMTQKDPIRVQVKTIDSASASRLSYHFNDKGRFFEFCKSSYQSEPKLFIGVDIDNNIGYWLHMSESFLDSLGNLKTVKFQAAQVMSDSSLTFIYDWINIVDNINDYFEGLQEFLDFSCNLPLPNHEKLHVFRFIKEFNRLLDNDFNIVKRVVYPNQARVGISLGVYDNDRLSYILFPIPIGSNENNICQIPPADIDEAFRWPFGHAARHCQGNPIKEAPEKLAKEIVQDYVFEIIKKQLLNYACHPFMATELIFALLKERRVSISGDRKSNLLHIPEADVYKVKLLKQTFDNYINFLKQGSNEEIETQKIGKIEHPFQIFGDAINYLVGLGREEIHRPYVKPDYTQTPIAKKVYGYYTREIIEQNLSKYIENLEKVYTSVININFPSLKEELSFYMNNSGYIYALNYEPTDEQRPLEPSLRIYCLRSENNATDKFCDFTTDETLINELKQIGWFEDKKITYKGKEYLVSANSFTDPFFLTSETPMFDTLYDLIGRKLLSYCGLTFKPAFT
ncbi:MAG: hypothetical protein NTY09_00035 [bacterium]|nr:hypothetical protein [bacterium]